MVTIEYYYRDLHEFLIIRELKSFITTSLKSIVVPVFFLKLFHMLYLLGRKLSYLPPYWTLHVSELLYPKLLMFLEKTFILLLGDTFLHWKHEKTHHKLTVLIDFHQSDRRQNQHIKISSFLYTKTKLAHKIRKKQK